ncbi:hypothetical protein M758_1G116800 [Ceratodon purpureus]|nr:hypothetical protein M758_1G116800 [Ceratodon purpureus]
MFCHFFAVIGVMWGHWSSHLWHGLRYLRMGTTCAHALALAALAFLGFALVKFGSLVWQ